MSLKSALVTTLINLGINEAEMELLSHRMMFTVTSLEAQVSALDAQIATLTAQRDAARQELESAFVTASKLVDPVMPEPEEVEADPVTGV